MAVRVSKLIRFLNIGSNELNEILHALNYKEDVSDLNAKIPDYIASRAIELFSDGYGDIRSWRQMVGENKLFTTTRRAYSEEKSFWINNIELLSPTNNDNRICLGPFDGAAGSPLYSVLIGTNGVGKSMLMKELVDFFIDLHAYINQYDSKPSVYKGRINSINYIIDGLECEVVRIKNNFIATIDGIIRPLRELRLPSIVACHFGAFDKFPIQTVNGFSQTKYDVPYYKYVGAHVNGNMISSSSIAFRLLFALNERMDDKQRENICSILDFIGYEHNISLSYSLILKTKISGTAWDSIYRRVEKDKEYTNLSMSRKEEVVSRLYKFYNDKLKSGKTQFSYNIDFDKDTISAENKDELYNIYKLKQCNLVNSNNVFFHRNGCDITSDEMSSGEFAILSTVLSVSAATNDPHTLVLLDEPELSLHPNWQMSLIDHLEMALAGKACHLLISTHSHMIVSDLPMKRSVVSQIEKDDEGGLKSTIIPECTYGWSAEEVLLKVFKMATDRNKYLADIIGDFLKRIGDNSITTEEVRTQVGFLSSVSENLSDIDPMKKIISTIIEDF